MPHTALLPGELLGRLELAMGTLGVQLNTDSSQLVCAQHRSCGQAVGTEEREAGSKLGAAFTLKDPMVMP